MTSMTFFFAEVVCVTIDGARARPRRNAENTERGDGTELTW